MANLQYVLHKGNKNTGSLKFVQPEAMQAVLEFHSGIAGYAQTPLVSLPNLAKLLGVGQIFVKDESSRFGLNAFKARLDPNKVGGTAFIGISRPVIKAHGGSNAEAIENAVGQAIQVAESGITGAIAAHIDKMQLPTV